MVINFNVKIMVLEGIVFIPQSLENEIMQENEVMQDFRNQKCY